MCLNPIWIPNKSAPVGNGRSVGRYVPCGHCIECLQHKRSQWYVRFWLEHKYYKNIDPSTYTGFLTLTFSDEYLPKTRLEALNYLRAFIKKVRRNYSNREIRYYFVSENGTEKGRFHFHGLLFNLPRNESPIPTEKFFKKLWTKGWMTFKYADGRLFTYITKYITKDVDPLKQPDSFDAIQVCSQKPRFGARFFRDVDVNSLLDKKSGFYLIPIDGYKYGVPRQLLETLLDAETLFFYKTNSSAVAPSTFNRQKNERLMNDYKKIYGFKKLKHILSRENSADSKF